MSLVPDQVPLIVISACQAVHRHIGPGLPAAIYRDCLDREFRMRELIFERNLTPIIDYCGVAVSSTELRIDYVIEDTVLLQVKAVDALLPTHKEELRTLLRITGARDGVLVNFNVMTDLRSGIRRLKAAPQQRAAAHGSAAAGSDA